ncbi:hypothetical protein ATL39_2987 [Sinobaca qinghaiensis]|uniref:Uncharacterized protein n=1 Tax=Sinobaca qinghaiensis TaxID=342944 RepID=A0A419UWQ7_9BACL|nr:hypothetical protein [Sinobaca qinghaiensis]RKD69567.1 hypothetical protein ATL39_2987 [Sinobaca qinghaiensis]
MNKTIIKILLILSLCFGTVALSLYIALLNDIYIFPTILFHTFLTQEAIVSGFLYLFFLLLMALFLSFIYNKYLIVFLVVSGFTGSLLFCLAFALSINSNETIFFSSPNNQYRFAILQKDILHNIQNDIYQIHNHWYAEQIADIKTNDGVDNFSPTNDDIIWHETNQFTIHLPLEQTKQEIVINYSQK